MRSVLNLVFNWNCFSKYSLRLARMFLLSRCQKSCLVVSVKVECVFQKPSHFMWCYHLNDRDDSRNHYLRDWHERRLNHWKVGEMYHDVEVEYCLHDESWYLSVKRYYILLLAFILHWVSDDSIGVIFLIMFPEVEQDPGINGHLSNQESLSKYAQD